MVDKIIIENLSLQYADGTESLRDVSMGIRQNAVTVLFGPAGGGKSTLLRCLNRLNDLTEIKSQHRADHDRRRKYPRPEDGCHRAAP